MSFAGEFTNAELKERLERIGVSLGCVGSFSLDDIQQRAYELMSMYQPWRVLARRLNELEADASTVRNELRELQSCCTHAKLPKRSFGEQYSDLCPDCGFVSYCYRG